MPKRKKKPQPSPKRTLDDLVAESEGLRARAAALHEKMLRLSAQLDKNERANAAERPSRPDRKGTGK